MRALFQGRAREEALTALKSCDDTLAILESGEADLGPARRIRDRAESLVRPDPRAALEAARHAEETAKLLDRLRTASAEGLARLRAERARMAKLGMGVRDVDALLKAAAEWMSRTVDRDGDPAFPAYAKAGELALKGLRIAQQRIPLFKESSAAVFEAEEALRRTVESNRFVEAGAFRFFVLKPAMDVLDAAKAKLAANAFAEARDLAQGAVATAGQIEAKVGRVTEAFLGVEEAARALRAEGAAVGEVEDLLAICRSALEQGKFDDALEISGRAAARLAELREAFRSLVLRRRTAEEAIAEVEQWGFDVREARRTLGQARDLMDAGRYEEAGSRLDEARAAARGLRDTHRATAARIGEMRKSLPSLRAADPDAATEAEGLLAKAEALLDEGKYRACEEDLQIASLILIDVPTARAAAKKPARPFHPFLEAARALSACETCGGPLADDGTCPTCSASPTAAENPPPGNAAPIQDAVDRAREVIERIGSTEDRLVREAAAQVQGCAMCGGPVETDDVLCARCQATVKGRA